MNLKQLREFADLARFGSFQETAASWNTTRSCISKHIRKLEDELGVSLFERAYRSVKLNEYGKAFAVFAHKITSLSETALRELEQLRSGGDRLPAPRQYELELKLLLEFEDLARTCNFQETAANWNTTQSCISKHIRKLEDELGVSLFDRTRRSVKLSSYGVLFSAYAREIAALSQEALNDIEKIKSSGDTCLRVGFRPILGQYGLVELIANFRKAYPEISVKLIESNKPEEMLRTRQCDVLFAPENTLASPSIRRILYIRDRLIAVVPHGHPLAVGDTVNLQQLREERFIVHEPSSPGYPQRASESFFRICREAGFVPTVVTKVSRTSTITRLVGQGQGVAILFRKYLPVNIVGVTILDVVPEVWVNMHAFFLGHSERPEALDTFLKYMKSVSDIEKK